ncbi:MAG: hypothetical protein O8C66_01940 [Candidatus Methanoperedens sp.]|nr:hypothetical protein [Candidatus Methanoperedens sp.]MCZ7369246.1 hypothetical protein [Candidatus Methanoperedens sp.]
MTSLPYFFYLLISMVNRVFNQNNPIALHIQQPHHPIPLASHLESIAGLSPNRRRIRAERAAGV